MSCVLFLIDESSVLTARVAEGTKSKADCFATALNALLSQLTAGPPIDVALVGYRRADAVTQDVGCRWGGPLEGKQLVSTSQLEANPWAVENRVRKIPGPGGYGVAREETVRFPVWYVPVLKASGSRRTALEFCRDLLVRQTTPSDSAAVSAGNDAVEGGTFAPMIVHFLAELSDKEGFQAAADVFGRENWKGPAPLVLHAHLAGSSRVPSTLYPSSHFNLSPHLLRYAFATSSVLPDPLAAGLRAAGAAFRPEARGLIYNARMVDLIRFLSVVKTYAAWASQASVVAASGDAATLRAGLPTPDAERPALCAGLPTPHTERPQVSSSERDLGSDDRRGQETRAERPPDGSETHPTAIVVFVLDRSSATPDASAADPKSPWRRLQDRANDLISQLARHAKASLQIATVAYGTDSGGKVQVITGFAGSAGGRAWLTPGEVRDGAIRVEEFVEQVSDGIGGLLKIPRKRHVLFDLAPTLPASPAEAFASVARMLIDWAKDHPGVRVQPVVVHCTRGEFEPDAVQDAVARLREAERAVGPIALYHAVLTESAHPAVAYPAKPDGVGPGALQALWEATSPLLGGAVLAGKRPGVSAESRGMVINAPFDVLTDAVGGGA